VPTVMRDVVMLGMTVPSLLKDGRRSICAAAYHADHGLIRIYPCTAAMKLSRWNVYDFDLERNPKDNRHESWKLTHSEQYSSSKLAPIQTKKITKPEDKLSILSSLVVDCVSEVNDVRGSLCVVRPQTIIKTSFRENQPAQTKSDMFGFVDSWLNTKSDYSHSPSIEFSCSDSCRIHHKMTVLEWGAYEWMRKHPGDGDRYWSNTNINKDGYETFLLLGNQANRRTSFIVINVICIKTGKALAIDSRRQISLDI